MSNTNNLVVIGNLAADPQGYKPQDGARPSMVRFRLLSTPHGKDAEKNPLKTIGFSCTAFGQTAETVNKYAKKGSPLLVLGRISNISAAMKDGDPIKTAGGEIIINTDVTVNEIQLLGTKSDATDSESSVSTATGTADPF